MAETTLADVGGWPAILGALSAGRDLGVELARAAMHDILSGSATTGQMAGFMIALRMKGETVEELDGMLDALMAVSQRVPVEDPFGVVDVVGTGGDRSHSINVSTISALVMAGAGARVCKHGNRAASSSCGAADVLEALGVAIELDGPAVARCIREAGIGFCFAPRFHPALRHAGPTRRELGIPTTFNILGPLANPAGARRLLVGVADPAMASRMLGVLQARGAKRVLLVHGDDGLDELTVTGQSRVWGLVDDGVAEWRLDPREFGFALHRIDDLRGADPAYNASVVRSVLDGKPGAARDVVLLNAGAGLYVAGVASDIADGIARAAASIDTGAAAEALGRLVDAAKGAN
jgi:anthranilate phosphoribosyltransferase